MPMGRQTLMLRLDMGVTPTLLQVTLRLCPHLSQTESRIKIKSSEEILPITMILWPLTMVTTTILIKLNKLTEIDFEQKFHVKNVSLSIKWWIWDVVLFYFVFSIQREPARSDSLKFWCLDFFRFSWLDVYRGAKIYQSDEYEYETN